MRHVFAILSILVLTGCAEHRLTVPRPNPTGAPVTVQSKTFGWGVKRHNEAAKCPTNLIDEVRIRQDFGQTLLSVLTLGFYASVRIEYVCANVPSTIGSTDN